MGTVIRKTPERKCLGCGEMLGKKGLLRIVRSKEGEISLDSTGKKPGRGAYICMDAECFKAARKRKGFERSFKCAISDEFYDDVLAQITESAKDG